MKKRFTVELELNPEIRTKGDVAHVLRRIAIQLEKDGARVIEPFHSCRIYDDNDTEVGAFNTAYYQEVTDG